MANQFNAVDRMSHLVRQLDIGGPGLTVLLKDVIDVAGFSTLAGSRSRRDSPPADRNADVVDALLAGGYRVIGKTKMHELAFGVTGVNEWVGTPPNPCYPDLIPGGSSSGSATAVAAGICDVALGTDTGGSVRVPAACCGVFGLKPTYGRISRAGLVPAESSLDCVGPFARDIARIVEVMAILDHNFRSPDSLGEVLLGVVDVDADVEVLEPIRRLISEVGLATRGVTLTEMTEAFQAGLTIINWENARAFSHLLGGGDLGLDVERRLAAALETTREDVDAAEKVRVRFTAAVDCALQSADVLVLPTMPVRPPRLSEAESASAIAPLTRLVRPFNLSGHPAISMPLHVDGNWPGSVQLVGRKDEEGALCAIASLIAARSSLVKGYARELA